MSRMFGQIDNKFDFYLTDILKSQFNFFQDAVNGIIIYYYNLNDNIVVPFFKGAE